jgi:hypothetical protein
MLLGEGQTLKFQANTSIFHPLLLRAFLITGLLESNTAIAQWVQLVLWLKLSPTTFSPSQ